jgi:hypothetical protein
MQRFISWLINALCVPSFVLPCPVTRFYDRRILPLPTPIDFVEQNSFVVLINPVASALIQLTPISLPSSPSSSSLLLSPPEASPSLSLGPYQRALALVFVLVLTVV